MSKRQRDESVETLLPPSKPEAECKCLRCVQCAQVEAYIQAAVQVLDADLEMDPNVYIEAHRMRAARHRVEQAEYTVRTGCFEHLPLGRFGVGVDMLVRSLKTSFWTLHEVCGEADEVDEVPEGEPVLTSAQIFKRSVSLMRSHLAQCARAIKDARKHEYDKAILVRGTIAMVVLQASHLLFSCKTAFSAIQDIRLKLHTVVQELPESPRLPTCTSRRPDPVCVEISEAALLPISLVSPDPPQVTAFSVVDV